MQIENTFRCKELAYLGDREGFNFCRKSEMDGQYYNLWSTDNDRTDANDDVVIKSVYDPSPVGYSIPASNAFTGFTTTGGNAGDWTNPVTPEERAKFNVKGVFDKGWYFYTKPNKKGGTIFFPAVGRRYLESGRLLGVNTSGWCWTTGPTNPGGGHLLNFASEYVYPLHGYGTRSDSFLVRSAEEKEWRYVVEICNVLTS